MSHTNILLLCSDEHTRSALGCYGSEIVRSPNLDRLASSGTRYARAYTTSPLCVPARASLISGQYVHQVRCWDNGQPYHGTPPGWAHLLRDLGYQTVTIGKNHFRSIADDNGFEHEILPMHVRDGVGDLLGLLRKSQISYSAGAPASASSPHNLDQREQPVSGPAILAEAAGPGESNHTHYDREITAAACEWIRKEACGRRPWALQVSYVAPHFPLTAPEEFYRLYDLDQIAMPNQYLASERPNHPVIQALTRAWNFDDFFDTGKVIRARAGYYGLVSFLDDNIGQILSAVANAGLADSTLIIYLSDHGEMLGNKGIWSTSALYEDSVAIPLILRGPNIEAGRVVTTPVSHVDILPTILHAATGSPPEPGHFAGSSLLDIPGHCPDRPVLSEYHAGGSITGCFMLRTGIWKYHHYVGYESELFNTEVDPQESVNLAGNPEFDKVRASCERKLREIVDPDAANALAFADQKRMIEKHGGEEAVRRRGSPGEHTLDRRLGAN